MALVTPEQVAVSLGRASLSRADYQQIEQWVADAELLVRLELTRRRGASAVLADLDEDTLTFVIREAAAARARNPEGYQSETIDDYTYRHGAETRSVTILDDWWGMLFPAQQLERYSVRPDFEPDTVAPDGFTEVAAP